MRQTDPGTNQVPKCSPGTHSLEHTKRFTELGREKKGEGGHRVDLVETKQSQKGERVIKPRITLPSKSGY